MGLPLASQYKYLCNVHQQYIRMVVLQVFRVCGIVYKHDIDIHTSSCADLEVEYLELM